MTNVARIKKRLPFEKAGISRAAECRKNDGY
jgi:hypothetical protein